MARLERMELENYRGASRRLDLEFDPTKPVTLIFGESGTGKTTIADALDALGNGAVGSLSDRSSTRAREHVPTIGKKPSDVRIAVRAGSQTWTCLLNKDNLTTTPAPRPLIRVLRRVHLQRLIEAQPAKRYEELRRFIEVENVERSENALGDAAKSVKAELENAVRQRTDAEEELRKAWEANGSPGDDAMTWARDFGRQDSEVLKQQARELRVVQDAINSAESALGALNEAASQLAKRKGEAKVVDDAVAGAARPDGEDLIGLVSLLQSVEEHLRSGSHADQCPVCRQSISIAALRSDIAARLESFREQVTLSGRRTNAYKVMDSAERDEVSRERELLTHARGLLELVVNPQLSALGELRARRADFAALEGPDDAAGVDAARKLVESLLVLKQSLASLETDLVQRSAKVGSIRQHYARVSATVDSTVQQKELHDALKAAYEVARVTRIEFSQRILDEVTGECNRLYAAIHPSEPIAISRLELDPKQRASLNQAASFEGHDDVPPQAYFSESHLDTLGFCFWLALAERDSASSEVTIVLDDIFTSVDAPHIRRIAQLIADEAKHFAHVVVATHQRLWRDLYKNQSGPGRLVQLIELQNWTLGKGISSYRTRLAVEELLDSVRNEPFERQTTAARAGVLLEAILDHLALQYCCRVARKHDGNYTLGELLDGTQSLFKKMELHRPVLDSHGAPVASAKHAVSDVREIVERIRGMALFRNQVGAHFNAGGTAISDSDIRDLARSTVELAEALSCGDCGQIPGKRTGSHFECSCDPARAIRMSPLQL
jgi:energy-coupling factor transporter ATP-binding protein EcfA2